MIFADKVIRLRKKNGWSQEELADKMNVSRQAVSKWEGAQTIPDLQKILQLANLFGVTTDYLLKDELEDEEFTPQDTEEPTRRVSLAQAHEFLSLSRQNAGRLALATAMCILSPTPLFLLLTGAEAGMGLTEDTAAVAGIVSILVVVASAVALFLFCGFRTSHYEFLETEPFDAEYGVRGMVEEQKKAFHPTYVRGNVAGTCICVLSPVPILLGALLDRESWMLPLICLTLTMVAAGVALFILVGTPWEGMEKLLQEGDYTPKNKRHEKVLGPLSGVYWLVVTAIYLAISFSGGSWRTSWVIWPVAGVLFAALWGVGKLILNNREK